MANVPEILSNLVGQQSAHRGALKVFEALQETRLNKQLFYVSHNVEFGQHCHLFYNSIDLIEIILYIKKI